MSSWARDDGSAAVRLRAVTPDDDNDLALGAARSLWVGGAGDVAVIAAGDTSAVTLVGVPAGSYLVVAARRVLETGTTATDIVALY